MRVVSFMNYKGGVGKTTVTANIGAGLAARGHRVLLIDLDPQANLTTSLLPYVDEESSISQDQTIKGWFEAHVAGATEIPSLASLLTTPPHTATKVAPCGGTLQLVASHLSLLEIDMQLASTLFAEDPRKGRRNQLKVHRILADALEDEEFAKFDFIFIDCAPDFGIVTRIAMVASDFIVVPAKADHLSTIGIDYLVRSLRRLVVEHNGLSPAVSQVSPEFLGVIFNMVQVYGKQPVASQQNVMKITSENIDIPIFDTRLRYGSRAAIASARSGVPAVLGSAEDGELVAELNALTDEFARRIARRR